MDNWILWALAGYIVVQIGISLGVFMYIKSEADYLLAGRSLGPFLATFSIFATWFGAETVMGSSGAIAAHGLAGSRSDPFGYTLCLLLMGLLLAGVLRKKNYVTIGDFFADYFGRKNEVLASLIMIPTSIIWAAAQIQALALILAAISPLDVGTAQLTSVIIVVAYTWLGGLMGDVIHDLLQGCVVIIGLIMLLGFVMLKAGGPITAIKMIEFKQLSLLGPHETWLSQFNVWLVPVLGSLVSPEALSRSLATRDEGVAKRSSFYASGIYFVVGLIPVLIALIGSHLIAPVQQADMFLPTLAKTMMPPWMMVVLLGALVSAILSTIDSTLLSIAGLASHNVILHAIKRPVSEKQKILLARLIVMASGALAYWIATSGQSIYGLVEMASSFGSAGFLVVMLCGLYGPKISPLGATCTMVGGVIFTLLFDYLWVLDGSYIFTILGCTAVYFGFALLQHFSKPNIAQA